MISNNKLLKGSPLQQDVNRLNWVAAMLSGQYKHGKHHLHTDGMYCAIGVAVAEAFEDYPDSNPSIAFDNKFVSNRWFIERFGVTLRAEYIQAVNDRCDDYYGVCAIVLDRCVPSMRKENLCKRLVDIVSGQVSVADKQSETVDAVQPDYVPDTNKGEA